MKEYSNGFDLSDNSYHISVSTNKDIITLGIDMGVEGFFAELNKKEADKLIEILKEAKKKANR